MKHQQKTKNQNLILEEELTVFICYRQIDGKSTAEWANQKLADRQLPFIPEGYKKPPRLSVYFDQTTPAVENWMDVHRPALERARAMVFIASPGAQNAQGSEDWVHLELNWWIKHREAAPIILDPTGEADRWLPMTLATRWPNAQRLSIELEYWKALPKKEKDTLEERAVQRILEGIQASENKARKEDLERERRRRLLLETQSQSLRRQRMLLTALLTIAIFTTITSFWSMRLAREEQGVAERQRSLANIKSNEAQLQAKRSEHISDFLIRLFKVSNPSESRGNTITAREILDKGTVLIEEELHGEPHVRAALLETMGSVYRDLGLNGVAEPLLADALEIRRQQPKRKKDLMMTLHAFAILKWRQSEYEDSASLLNEAVGIGRALSDESAALASSLNALAVLSIELDDFDKAEHLFQELVGLQKLTLGEDHPKVAESINNYGALLLLRGHYKEAEPLYREALRIRIKQFGENHPAVASSTNNLAGLMWETKNYKSAEELFSRALAIRRRVFGDDHAIVANSYSNMASVLQRKGLFGEAEHHARMALDIRKRSLDLGHPDLGESQMTLASILIDRQKYLEAKELAEDAVAIFSEKFEPTHTRVAKSKMILGRNLAKMKRFDAAEELLLESHSILEEKRGPTSSDNLNSLKYLEELYLDWGKLKLSEEFRLEHYRLLEEETLR